MDEEVEDFIGDIKYTDSQNTIPSSLIYQVSVSGSNSDEYNSSGKDTYVIECDSDDGITCEVNFSKTGRYTNPNCFNSHKHGLSNAKATMTAALTNKQDYSVVSQETYTQTSKTIMQLAKAEQGMMKTKSLQTQTSRFLITEKQSTEVKIEVHCPSANVASDSLGNIKLHNKEIVMPCAKIKEYDPIAHKHAIEDILDVVDDFNDDGSFDNSYTNTPSGCQFSDREMDNDSLSDELKKDIQADTTSENSEISKSTRNDVDELYRKISEINIYGAKRADNYVQPISALTPLTEESLRKESITNSFGINHNIQNLLLKDQCISDSLLYNEPFRRDLDKLNDNITVEKCMCTDFKSYLFDSKVCIENADNCNVQIHNNVNRTKVDNVKNPPAPANPIMRFFKSDQSSDTSRSYLASLSASDKLSNINDEMGFGRHDKVLGKISSLFNKSQFEPQNRVHTKKSVTIANARIQNNMERDINYSEESKSQTIPMKSSHQVKQYNEKIKPAFVKYEQSDRFCGNNSNSHTIDADSIDINIKLLPDSVNGHKKRYKLPQLKRNSNDKPVSCPNSSRVNVLLTVNASSKRPASKPDVLPHIRINKVNTDFSMASSKNLDRASNKDKKLCLPPINGKTIKSAVVKHRNVRKLHDPSHSEVFQDMISVDGMIRELSTSSRPEPSARSNRISRSPSRGQSPGASTTASEMGPSLEKACDNMLIDILRRLRSLNWLEVVDSLNDIPRQMSKFWGATPESRVADLIRQVTALTDSPRTQVARSACTALPEILKKTNCTNKPQFFEAMASLLAKSGSSNRCVRRAANLALDDVISSVELTKAVTALTIHGADHKSPLVRSATARLLVVCCALGSGGGDLLKSKPPSIATARRLALKTLSTLIEDKNSETRKFAERLYILLRQQPNFEAFYLTDVDVDLASRHIKKYDQLFFEVDEEAHKRTR